MINWTFIKAYYIERYGNRTQLYAKWNFIQNSTSPLNIMDPESKITHVREVFISFFYISIRIIFFMKPIKINPFIKIAQHYLRHSSAVLNTITSFKRVAYGRTFARKFRNLNVPVPSIYKIHTCWAFLASLGTKFSGKTWCTENEGWSTPACLLMSSHLSSPYTWRMNSAIFSRISPYILKPETTM